MKTMPLSITAVVLMGFMGFPSCQQPQPPSPVASTAIHPAADPESRALAAREHARREQALLEARALLESGKRKAAVGDREGAVKTFRQSIDTHP